MKISASKFYREVTGKTTASHATVLPALKRWGVPIPVGYVKKTEVFDIEHLPQAKIIWAKEQEEVAARRARRLANHRPLDGVPPKNTHESYFTTLDKINKRLTGIEQCLNSILKIWGE